MNDNQPTLKAEMRLFLKIALPLAAAYLAEYAMFITTKMVVGKLGYHQLAAVGIAGDLSFEVLVVLMGLLSIIGVLAAQAEGAGNKSEVGQSVRQGMLVASMIGIPAMVLIWNLDLVLQATHQDPVVIELAIPYLQGLSAFVLPVLVFGIQEFCCRTGPASGSHGDYHCSGFSQLFAHNLVCIRWLRP